MQIEVYLSLNAPALEMRLLTSRLGGDFHGSELQLSTNILKLIILLIQPSARRVSNNPPVLRRQLYFCCGPGLNIVMASVMATQLLS